MAQKKHNVHFDITAQDRASQALAAVEKNLTGVMLAAVSVGGIGTAFTAFMADAIKTRSALDDLADTTGDNVRTLDALRRQAVVSGVEFDALGGSLTKFARNLNAADDEGQAAGQAIAKIGLNVESLRAMKPADAMIEVARALGEFEDGAGKVAVAIALMGKEGAKMLPFLKDLAETGELNGRITAEQAAQAERVEKEWRKLNLAFKDGKDAIATELIPAMSDYIEQLRVGIKLTGSLGAAILHLGTINPFRSLDGNIKSRQEQLAEIEKARANPGMQDAFGKTFRDISPARLNEREAQLKSEIEFLKFQQRQDALKLTGPQYLDARDLQAGKKPQLDFVPKGPAKAAQEKRVDDSERIAKLIADAEEQSAKDTADAWNYYTKQQLAEQEAAAKAQADMWKQVFEAIDKEQEDAIEDGKILLDSLNAKAEKASDVARQLGFTFSSAFEDAIAGGKGLREILGGIAMDVAKIGVRKTLTEPLAAGISGLFDKIDIGGLLGFGGAEQIAGPRAAGGPVGAGKTYLVGEEGPELFTPSGSGQIIPNDALGGMGGVTIVQHMTFGSDVDRATLRAWGQTVKQETMAAVADARMRGGSYAGAFRG